MLAPYGTWDRPQLLTQSIGRLREGSQVVSE